MPSSDHSLLVRMNAGLVISSLALSWLVAGCMPAESDKSGTGGSGGSRAAGGAGATGGSSSTAGTGGSNNPGGTGGTGGSANSGSADASASTGSDMRAAEAAPAPSGNVDWQVCGAVSFKPDVSPEDFCAKYMSACGFDPAGARSRFKSVEDCKTRYGGLSDGPKGGKACVAWYICIAAQDSPDTYCPHAAAASMMSGPCKPSYL